MNTGEPQTEWPPQYWAELRVQKIETELHQWASDDSGRQFHEVFNLSVIPRSCWSRGSECGVTGVPGRPVWTGPPRSSSSRAEAWSRSSPRSATT